MALNITLKELLLHSKNLPQIGVSCKWRSGYLAVWIGRGENVGDMFKEMAYVYGKDFVVTLCNSNILSFDGNCYDTMYLVIDCDAPSEFGYEYSLEGTWEDIRDQIDENKDWQHNIWDAQIKDLVYKEDV